MITLFFFFSSIFFIGLRWVNGKRPVRSRGLKPHIIKVTQMTQMTQISLLCVFCIGHKRAKKKSASSANWKSAAEGKAKSAWQYITQIRFLDRTGRFPSNLCVIRGARTFRSFRVIRWIMTHPLSPHFTGKQQGSICHDEKVAYRPVTNLAIQFGSLYATMKRWRIDPSSCSGACSMDNIT